MHEKMLNTHNKLDKVCERTQDWHCSKTQPGQTYALQVNKTSLAELVG